MDYFRFGFPLAKLAFSIHYIPACAFSKLRQCAIPLTSKPRQKHEAWLNGIIATIFNSFMARTPYLYIAFLSKQSTNGFYIYSISLKTMSKQPADVFLLVGTIEGIKLPQFFFYAGKPLCVRYLDDITSFLRLFVYPLFFFPFSSANSPFFPSLSHYSPVRPAPSDRLITSNRPTQWPVGVFLMYLFQWDIDRIVLILQHEIKS
jgi:hypothetical protein